MEREIPDVWNIFALGNPAHLDKRRGGVALPGLSTSQVDTTQYKWTHREDKQHYKWADRSDFCERPRTYDKFYQKTPMSFQEPGTDSAISVCSSEENDEYKKGKNSVDKKHNTDKKRKKTKKSADDRQSRKDVHYSKTLTEHDVKHIERHLSMKRTIRKKIMRDLQQAFVQDPKEFAKNPKQDKRKELEMQFINVEKKMVNGQSEPNFLDMLRDSDDSGNCSPSRSNKFKFRSCRERRRIPDLSDSSSCDDQTATIQQPSWAEGRMPGRRKQQEARKQHSSCDSRGESSATVSRKQHSSCDSRAEAGTVSRKQHNSCDSRGHGGQEVAVSKKLLSHGDSVGREMDRLKINDRKLNSSSTGGPLQMDKRRQLLENSIEKRTMECPPPDYDQDADEIGESGKKYEIGECGKKDESKKDKRSFWQKITGKKNKERDKK